MSEEVKNGQGMPDLSRIIGALSANPQLLSGLLSSLGAGGQKSDISEPPDENAALPAALPLPFAKAKSGKRELLCALKPFLSPHRCESIDRILHMYDLFDLLKNYR